MESSKSFQLRSNPDQLFTKLSNVQVLKQLFLDSNLLNFNSDNFDIEIQPSNLPKNILDGKIQGCVKWAKQKTNFPKLYFLIEFQKIKSKSTYINFIFSDDPFRFSKSYQLVLAKTIKNIYKKTKIIALVLVVFLVPAGISAYYDSIPDDSGGIYTTFSDEERTLLTAGLYLDADEATTAFKLYEKIILQNPDSLESIIGARSSLSEMPNYESLLRDYDSLIVLGSKLS